MCTDIPMKQIAVLVLGLMVSAAFGQQTPEAKRFYNEANKHFKAGRYDQALAMYDSAIAHQEHEFFFYQKGLAYRRLGEELKAIQAFRESVRIHPKFAAGYHALATGFYKLRQYDSAVVNYERAFKENPKLEPARKGMVTVLTAQALDASDRGDAASAARYAQQALRIDPSTMQALVIRARALNTTGNYHEALDASLEAAKLPHPALRGAAYFEMAIAHLHLGDTLHARTAFIEARKDTAYARHVDVELERLGR